MSGPSLPRPIPGSNAIGSFIIGVSPIGDIVPFDPWATIISQFANSPILSQLIVNFAAYVDQTKNLQDFLDLIWNVDTAIGHGLDVWGKIVGVSRTLTINSVTYFGFAEQGATIDTFNSVSFYSGQGATSNFDLSDTAYQKLIFAKALANISDGSIKSINQLLLNLFPFRGNCFVVDNGDMSLVYKFQFILTPVEAAIVSTSGVLPKPVGVQSSIVQGY